MAPPGVKEVGQALVGALEAEAGKRIPPTVFSFSQPLHDAFPLPGISRGQFLPTGRVDFTSLVSCPTP